MKKDFRKNVLATISQILTKIHNLKRFQNQKLRQSYLQGISVDVQLLRSDLMFILNQNFYLQCKLAEKDNLIDQIEKKCERLQQRSKLNIRITKNKYEKILHNLKYQQFLMKDTETQQQAAKEVTFCPQMPFRQYSSVQDQQLPTPKKTISSRQVKSSLDNKQTHQKRERNGYTLQKEAVKTQNFRLEARLAESVESQQLNRLEEKFSIQRATSNQLIKNDSSNRKKSQVHNQSKKNSAEEGQHPKQQQLRLLVTQQFKVPALKQSYFCTDLK